MNLFDVAWDHIMKGRIPNDLPYDYFHGTSAENARSIMAEGAEPYFFGSPHDEDAQNYAFQHDVPAMLSFEIPKNMTPLDPTDYNYIFGEEEYGHIMTPNMRLDPRYLHLIAMGHEGMDEREWYDHSNAMINMLHNQIVVRNKMNSPDILDLYRRRYS